jgi:hypothetical protein
MDNPSVEPTILVVDDDKLIQECWPDQSEKAAWLPFVIAWKLLFFGVL